MRNRITANRFIVFLLYLAIFISPVGAQAFTLDTTVGRLSILRGLIMVLLLMSLMDKLTGNGRLVIARRGNYYSSLFMLLWLLYSIASAVWANDFSGWLRYIYFIFIGVVSMILIINYFDSSTAIIKGFFALNLGIIIQSLIGWYEVITRDYRFINDNLVYEYGIRAINRMPIAMSGNPNDFAMLMFLGVLISYYFFKNGKKDILESYLLL